MSAVYMSLFKTKGVECQVVAAVPQYQPGDVIEFCSEVSPGEPSGPALAVVLGRRDEGYEIELLGAADSDYGKYVSERNVVPTLSLATSSSDLHKDTVLEMVSGMRKVSHIADDIPWKKLTWFPRHRRNPAAKVITKLRASLGSARQVRQKTPGVNFASLGAWEGVGGLFIQIASRSRIYLPSVVWFVSSFGCGVLAWCVSGVAICRFGRFFCVLVCFLDTFPTWWTRFVRVSLPGVFVGLWFRRVVGSFCVCVVGFSVFVRVAVS